MPYSLRQESDFGMLPESFFIEEAGVNLPKAHAKGMKGGQRAGIVREVPPKAHAKDVKDGHL